MSGQVTISYVGAAGDGVAETETGVVYVPFTLPDEVVNIAHEGMRGTLIALKQPSPQRIKPVCRHFEDCGGCVLQNWESHHYQAWKREIVVSALAAHGLDVPVDALVPARPQTRRRVTLTARTGLSGQVVGFNRYQSHDVVEITQCPVTVPEIVARFDDIRHLSAFLADRNKTFHITVTLAKNGLDIAIDAAKPINDKERQNLVRFAVDKGIARISVNGEIIIEQEKPLIDFGPVAVEIPPGGFLQATADAEDRLGRLVLEGLGRTKRAVDLFCGAGTFTFRMAEKMNVHAVEHDYAALHALDRAARQATGLKTVSHEERDLFRRPMTFKELAGFDGFVFNPPRAGAQEQAKEIAKAVIPHGVAVSCNPVTLARDLAILVEGGYELKRVVPVDQFLWTSHVEVVAFLTRRRSKPGWTL